MLTLLGSASGAAADERRLIDAVRRGDTAAVRALIAERADVNVAQPDGTTALHWAANRTDIEAADLLLRSGANVGAENDFGVTALSLACENGSAAMIRRLLQAGADPNSALKNGETALMTASRTGNLDAVMALLERGSDPNARDRVKGQTALMWAVGERHLDVAGALLRHGADIHARSDGGFTALLFAAREGDREMAGALLEAGASVHETAVDGSTPLVVAGVRGHVPFARLMLEHGADANAIGTGYTALHWAAGSWETVDFGANGVVNPLGGLSAGDKAELIAALFAHGADPNARLEKAPPRFGFSLFGFRLVGATPFWLAAMAGDATTMRTLVAHGADPTLKSADNTTPLMVASGLGRVVGETRVTDRDGLVVAMLACELGGDVQAANDNGETALHGAAYAGAPSVIEFLAGKGAKLEAKNRRGWTPLTIAEGVNQSGAVIVHEAAAALLRKLSAGQ
jgi:ankyrin repeat protein